MTKIPLLLYSTNASLVYTIIERFGINKHKFWCTTFFDSKRLAHSETGFQNPPSANPCDIYMRLKTAVEKNDLHDHKIIEIRAKIKELAVTWESEGRIEDNVKNGIIFTVDNAEIAQFEPLLYIIPFHKVKNKMREVAPQHASHLFSQEYIVSDITKDEFDRINF